MVDFLSFSVFSYMISGLILIFVMLTFFPWKMQSLGRSPDFTSQSYLLSSCLALLWFSNHYNSEIIKYNKKTYSLVRFLFRNKKSIFFPKFLPKFLKLLQCLFVCIIQGLAGETLLTCYFTRFYFGRTKWAISCVSFMYLDHFTSYKIID